MIWFNLCKYVPWWLRTQTVERPETELVYIFKFKGMIKNYFFLIWKIQGTYPIVKIPSTPEFESRPSSWSSVVPRPLSPPSSFVSDICSWCSIPTAHIVFFNIYFHTKIVTLQSSKGVSRIYAGEVVEPFSMYVARKLARGLDKTGWWTGPLLQGVPISTIAIIDLFCYHVLFLPVYY